MTQIQFPEIQLQTRDSHKLRGYFGSVFKEYSPLLHNHFNDGTLRYQYPLVQYKVLNGVPTLVAIEEGAELLVQLFLKIKQLEIEGQYYEIRSKNIESKKMELGYADYLLEYNFHTLWMALNQKNYGIYMQLNSAEKQNMLNKILVGNVLSLFKNMGVHLVEHQRLMASVKVKEKSTHFKNNHMLAFEGGFTINAHLPKNLGIGKAVSRGFGTIH
ncbi:DNA repair protein [Fulvivirga maritima]|uniref:CRISPR-associated endonuclease Cas6 n=1 Tax=Fulvivirga maritima TaxID=2904247 RepID=UPI001F32AC18|nr:CRISPR-associated endonuclease Cas6 [Fulvivirga maritima]UII27649.1 DNA repair protein [Fulvivirga maritima]